MATPKPRRGSSRSDAAGESRLIGTWRITECDLWYTDDLDRLDPAALTVPVSSRSAW